MTRLITACVLAGIVAVLCYVSQAAAAAEESIGTLRDRIAEAERQKLELLKTLALIFETRGDKEKAIAYSRQAFMIDPSDEALGRKLLGLLRQEERWTEMIPLYERLIDERPGRSQEYLRELATCHFKLGETDRALEALEWYRKDYAEYEATYLKLTEILSDNDRLADAATLLEEAVADRFKDHYRLHWQLGIVYIELSEIDKAIDAYETALDLVEPGNHRNTINTHLINLYQKVNRLDEVIAKREHEIEEIDAKIVRLYWADAEQNEKAGRIPEAIKAYRKIVALSPDSDTGKAAAAKVDVLSPKPEE